MPAAVALRPLPDEHVHRPLAVYPFGDLVTKRAHVEPVPERLTLAEQDRPHREVQLVDQARLHVLANRRGAAADPDVLSVRRFLRLRERRMDAIRDEAELRAALHHHRLSRVVRQHERRHVIRRLVAPPALPALVRPWAAHGAEHVAAEDPCTEAPEPTLGDLVVDAGFTDVAFAVHALEDASREEPLHDLRAAFAQRVLE